MSTEPHTNHPNAGVIRPRPPSGLRKLTLGMLQTNTLADGFKGLPEGAKSPAYVLGAFKEAAPALGLAPRLTHAIDWFFKFTQAIDWQEGNRPIVWPSAAMQQEQLGLGASQVKSLNRYLAEIGLITIKDSPNGKRYGRRGKDGRIIEAYGFDLSPLAARYEEFVRLAAAAQLERERKRTMRRRISVASNQIKQIIETAAEHDLEATTWQQLEDDRRVVRAGARLAETSEELELVAKALERRQAEALARLNEALKSVNIDPMGPENRPHQYTYNPTLNLQEDTVIARRGG